MDAYIRTFLSRTHVYIKKELFEELYDQGIYLVHGLNASMENKFVPMWDKIMLRKRCIIECINDLLKNKANLVHSRPHSIYNFIINLCGALAAYAFFENKPEALPVQWKRRNNWRSFKKILSRTHVRIEIMLPQSDTEFFINIIHKFVWNGLMTHLF